MGGAGSWVWGPEGMASEGTLGWSSSILSRPSPASGLKLLMENETCTLLISYSCSK